MSIGCHRNVCLERPCHYTISLSSDRNLAQHVTLIVNETPNKLLPLAALLIRFKLTKLEEITFKNRACQLHLTWRPHQSQIRDAHFLYNETERLIMPERLVASGLWVIKLANSVWLIMMIVHSCELFSQSKQWCSVCGELVFSCQVCFCLCTGFVAVSSTASSTEHPCSCKNTQPKMWSAGFREPVGRENTTSIQIFDIDYILHCVLSSLHFVCHVPANWLTNVNVPSHEAGCSLPSLVPHHPV